MAIAKPNLIHHEMATFVHGTLAGLHLLGIVYGMRRKNWFDTAAHTFGLAFSVRAALHHVDACKVKSG